MGVNVSFLMGAVARLTLDKDMSGTNRTITVHVVGQLQIADADTPDLLRLAY